MITQVSDGEMELEEARESAVYILILNIIAWYVKSMEQARHLSCGSSARRDSIITHVSEHDAEVEELEEPV